MSDERETLTEPRRNWREHTYSPAEMTEQEIVAEVNHLAEIYPRMSHYSRDAVANRHDRLVMEYRRRVKEGEWVGPTWAVPS